MATVIDALVVTLGLDAADFAKGQASAKTALATTRTDAGKAAADLKSTAMVATRTANEMSSRGKVAGEFFSNVKNQALGLMTVLLGSTGLAAAVSQTVGALAGLGRASVNIGVSVPALGAFRNAIQAAGGDADAAQASLQKLAEGQEQWRDFNSGAGLPYLRTIGAEKTDDPLAIFRKFNTWANQPDQLKNRARVRMLGQSIGLDEGSINEGAKSVSQVTKDLAEGASTAATKQQVDDMSALQRAFFLATQEAAKLRNELVDDLAPGLTTVLDAITAWAKLHPVRAEVAGVAVPLAATAAGTWTLSKVARALLGGAAKVAPVLPEVAAAAVPAAAVALPAAEAGAGALAVGGAVAAAPAVATAAAATAAGLALAAVSHWIDSKFPALRRLDNATEGLFGNKPSGLPGDAAAPTTDDTTTAADQAAGLLGAAAPIMALVTGILGTGAAAAALQWLLKTALDKYGIGPGAGAAGAAPDDGPPSGAGNIGESSWSAFHPGAGAAPLPGTDGGSAAPLPGSTDGGRGTGYQLPPQIETALRSLATGAGLDPDHMVALARIEHGDRDSPAGAIGPMQLMPRTAAGLGVNPRDWMDNLRGGVAYWKQQLEHFGGNVAAADAAYNAGAHNRGVERFAATGDPSAMPAETRAYIRNIAATAAAYAKSGGEPMRSATNDNAGDRTQNFHGDIHVHTAATDGKGVARAMKDEFSARWIASLGNTGLT